MVSAAADGVAAEPAEGEGVVETSQRSLPGEKALEIAERLSALLSGLHLERVPRTVSKRGRHG
jgi:hypothetical protein